MRRDPSSRLQRSGKPGPFRDFRVVRRAGSRALGVSPATIVLPTVPVDHFVIPETASPKNL
jgi:hypothetical protein